MISRFRILAMMVLLIAAGLFILRSTFAVPVGMGASIQASSTAAVFLPFLNKSQPTPTPTQEPSVDPNNWLQYVNFFRNIAGVPPVNDDSTLNNNCWEHARYMAENNHLTHDQNPGLPYASPAGQICAQSGNAWMGGEFFQPYWQVHHSIEGWLGSVGHRAWMLYPTTPTFGYGFYTASNNRAAAALDVLSMANFAGDTNYAGWPVIYPAPNQTGIPASSYPITILWRYFGPAPLLTSSTVTTLGGSAIAHSADTNLPVGHKGIQILPTQSLPANTTIVVTVNCTYEGVPCQYSWQFTTTNTLNIMEGVVE